MKKIFLFLILFLSSLNLHAASLKKGDMAPDFKTTDEQGKAVS
ncbi:MAG: thioredoxin family protein, partial [Deltaproteobacteria bacterium]|nr:thioredoxin family protein [Deltaproteobacteria bacterium]